MSAVHAVPNEDRYLNLRPNQGRDLESDPSQLASAALVDSIHACCDARGDDEANRAALIAEAAKLSVAHQVDMTRHFNEQAALWIAATKGAEA